MDCVGCSWFEGRLFSLGDYPGIQFGAGGMVVGQACAIAVELKAVLDEMEGLAPTPDARWAM
jgi:gamma-glutamylcyclotransferase (GGCT)/AIG2-like uncharacterized protein YtfP